jgi:hypothetical protein
MMKHFTSEDWIDYARNVQTADVSARMKEHLESCDECRESFQLWANVNKTAAEDLNYAPPSDALRIAQSQFVPFQPAGSFLGELMANLVFDTAQQPLPAGVRSSSNVCRQLLYQHGQRFIDLRVEKAPNSEEVSLIGQIQESTSGKQTTIPVVLCCGERIMQQTETNDMGEFHMVFSPVENLHLELDISEKKIRVRVPEFPDVGK